MSSVVRKGLTWFKDGVDRHIVVFLSSRHFSPAQIAADWLPQARILHPWGPIRPR
jgi:hypothetical protein